MESSEFHGILDYNVRTRLERALSQRLYLIDANKHSDREWEFIVEGSTGNAYTVDVCDKLSCSCMDFRTRNLICKHIYFVIARVLKSSSIINDIGSEPNVCIFSLKLNISENFDSNLNPRFKTSSLEKFSELKVKPDDVCSICYENYLDTDITIKCKECNNFFHNNCMNIWLRKSTRCSCPMCRTAWSN